MKNEIILFENQNVKLEVNVKDETVWLSLEQLETLFNRDRTVIKRHINNIFKEDESITFSKFFSAVKENCSGVIIYIFSP